MEIEYTAHPIDDVISLMVYDQDEIEPVRLEGHSLDDPDTRVIDEIVAVESDDTDVVVTGLKRGDEIKIRMRQVDVEVKRLSDLNSIPLVRLL